MIIARNELEGAVRKAALGLKWPGGLADDVNGAVGWMARRGLLDLASANAALAAPAEGEIAETTDGLTLNYQSAVRVGPSVFDLVLSGEWPVIANISVGADLLLGYGGLAAGDGAFRLSWDGGEAVVWARGAELSGPAPTSGVIRVEAASADDLAETGVDLIEVSDQDWAGLQKLAATYYVPATEESRLSGAGAGLNDND